MSLGNLGVVMALVQGELASAFTARSNQGLALSDTTVRNVLTRADFVNTLNAKYAPRTVGVTSSYVTTDTGPSNVVALIADNSHSADLWVQLFQDIAGTPVCFAVVKVPTGAATAVIFHEPLPTTTGSWGWRTTTAALGSTQTNGDKVFAAFVYTK